MRTFLLPDQVIQLQHDEISKELKGWFIGFPDSQVAFVENLISLCRCSLALKKLSAKPPSEEFIKGAEEMLVTLNNLKETVEIKRNGP